MMRVQLADPNKRRAALYYVAAGGACAFGLAVAAAIEPFAAGGFRPRIYAPVHTVLEFASIVVSFAVFTVGWYGYRQTRNRQDLFIAAAYMAVGIIDFVHALSYKGMPDFLGANSVGKAAAYWLAARLVDAAALFGAAFVLPAGKRNWIRPSVLMPAAIGICVASIAIISIYGDTASQMLFDPSTGLTRLKIALEWVVIVLFAGAFWAFGRGYGWQRDSVLLLQTAFIIAIASEICFTLYRTAYDGYNLLGHIYKVGAYYLVLQALFVSSLERPYRELSQTKEQLQKSFIRIGEALASGLTKGPTLQLISSLAREMFGADAAGIGQIDNEGMVSVTASDGIDLLEPIRAPVRGTFTEDSFVSGRPVLIPDLSGHPRVRPELLTLGIRSFMAAPIVTDGRPAGAVYVGAHDPGRFTPEQAETLMVFARHAAVALTNAERYEREHRIADALQRVIFPPPKIRVGSFDIAGKYEPAWDEARVGGDFYDYFDAGDGRLGVAIGDVSGKGLDAAVHTAVAKYSYQAYVREGFSPSQAVQRVGEAFEEYAQRYNVPENVFISLFCGILDTRSGRLVYSNAGHEPPVQVHRTGQVSTLDPTGPILGIGVIARPGDVETVVEPGDILVLYTDGITEARAKGELYGHDSLVQALSNCRDCSPEDIAERIYQGAKAHARGIVQDDIALIVLRRAPG